jgi:hypothetical protein
MLNKYTRPGIRKVTDRNKIDIINTRPSNPLSDQGIIILIGSTLNKKTKSQDAIKPIIMPTTKPKNLYLYNFRVIMFEPEILAFEKNL